MQCAQQGMPGLGCIIQWLTANGTCNLLARFPVQPCGRRHQDAAPHHPAHEVQQQRGAANLLPADGGLWGAGGVSGRAAGEERHMAAGQASAQGHRSGLAERLRDACATVWLSRSAEVQQLAGQSVACGTPWVARGAPLRAGSSHTTMLTTSCCVCDALVSHRSTSTTRTSGWRRSSSFGQRRSSCGLNISSAPT